MFILRALALIVFLLPFTASAQDFPNYENTYVNDYADLLTPAEVSRITRALETLQKDTGVEATVLTLDTQSTYRSEGSMESFATDLFNTWGIGDATKNDGILIMVLRTDRAMRIELGSGYNAGFNRVARDIIEDVMMPRFRENAYGPGIEAGTLAVIERIARVNAAGQEAPVRRDPKDLFDFIPFLFVGIIGTIMVFGRRITDRFRRCPSCGQRGAHTTRETLKSPTRTSAGEGERTQTCRHCNFVNRSTYRIARRGSSSSGGSFGGGSSSGGGASGRW
ncbi:MAG: TPM domain-containing protein [Maritimibacter sp.]